MCSFRSFYNAKRVGLWGSAPGPALPHPPWLGGRGAPLPHPPRGGASSCAPPPPPFPNPWICPCAEADPGGGGGAEGAIAPPLSLRTRPFFILYHAPFNFVPRPFRLPKCRDLRTCENKSTRDVRKVPINEDEIFIAEPQPAPQSGGSKQPLPD